MSLVAVAARFDPFRAEPDCVFTAPPGATIAELVARCRPPEWFPLVGHVALRTAAGVAEVMPEHWRRVRPRGGVAVAVYALPMGGGGGRRGGKNVLATVAALAVLAAATAISGGLLGPAGLGLFGASFAAGGIGATLTGAAVGIVGSLAINALAPPPVSPNARGDQAANGAEAQQRVAGINGNVLARGMQVPCVAGSMVASPPLLARPYTSFEGGEPYAHAIVGLWGRYDISDIKINGTDAALVPDLQMEVLDGSSPEQRITVAPDTVIEDRTIGQLSEWKLDRTSTTTVENAANPAASAPIWHYATTDGSADKIRIRVQFPSGLVRNDLATGNQSRIGVALRIAMRPVGQAQWINLPEIHYTDPDATVRQITQEIVIDWDRRVPNQRQTLSADFHTYRAYGYNGPEAWRWAPNAYFLSGATNDAPANTFLTSDGVTFCLADSAIARGAYEIRLMRSLAYEQLLTAAGQYPLRLFDTGGTSVPVAQRDKVSSMYVETLQTFRAEYPLAPRQPVALIAVRGRGLQLESISARFASHAPVWTGAGWSSSTSPTANPAAIYRRMLLDYHAVTGKLPDAMRDDAGLGAWHAHCAAKGYEVNAVLGGGTLQENLQIVAAAGWAVPRYGQSWGVVMERDRSAETPVQMLTPLNGRALQWQKSFDALPHAIAAEFIDAARDYKPRDDVFVYRPGFSAQNATDYETVNYTGITSEAQARARARLDMGQLLYRRSTYRLDIFIEHLLARRGDLVLLTHDTLGTRYGFGRIVSVTEAGGNIVAVTLDADLSIPAGQADLFSLGDLYGGGALGPAFQPGAFQEDAFGDGSDAGDLFQASALAAVAIRHATGQAITYPILDPAGGRVLTFDPPVPAAAGIVPGCVAAIGARGMATRRCIVFDVRRNDSETATVTLVDEAPRLHQ